MANKKVKDSTVINGVEVKLYRDTDHGKRYMLVPENSKVISDELNNYITYIMSSQYLSTKLNLTTSLLNILTFINLFYLKHENYIAIDFMKSCHDEKLVFSFSLIEVDKDCVEIATYEYVNESYTIDIKPELKTQLNCSDVVGQNRNNLFGHFPMMVELGMDPSKSMGMMNGGMTGMNYGLGMNPGTGMNPMGNDFEKSNKTDMSVELLKSINNNTAFISQMVFNLLKENKH